LQAYIELSNEGTRQASSLQPQQSPKQLNNIHSRKDAMLPSLGDDCYIAY